MIGIVAYSILRVELRDWSELFDDFVRYFHNLRCLAPANVNVLLSNGDPAAYIFHEGSQTDTADQYQIHLVRNRTEEVNLGPEEVEILRGHEDVRRYHFRRQLGQLFGSRIPQEELCLTSDPSDVPNQGFRHRTLEVLASASFVFDLAMALISRDEDRNHNTASDSRELGPASPSAEDSWRCARPIDPEKPANLFSHFHSPDRSSMEPGNYP